MSADKDRGIRRQKQKRAKQRKKQGKTAPSAGAVRSAENKRSAPQAAVAPQG
jgi:hypothetical protein